MSSRSPEWPNTSTDLHGHRPDIDDERPRRHWLTDTSLLTDIASLGAPVPILTFHLVGGRHSRGDIRSLISACCRDYAEVLGSPMERVRSFVHLHDPGLTLVAGSFIDDEDLTARSSNSLSSVDGR